MAGQSNAEYWAQRMKNMEDALKDKSYEYVENLERQFTLAQTELEKQIAAWYQRFAANNEITLADAKRLLNSDELAEFRWSVGEYIAYGQQNALDGAWMKQLENASARVHISRLESLKLQIQQQAEVLYGNQLDSVDAAARQIYEGSYYHTAFEVQRGLGAGWTMQAINEDAITKVLSRPWTTDNQTFRDRCWANKQSLVNTVNTQLTQMIIRGEAPDKAIAAVAKQFEVSKSKAGRLVMTESAYFSSAAQKDCFNALGVEQYTWICSFDKDTCELCGALDGKVFKMSEYQVGLTAPPAHPWCRCCTAPYFEDMAGIGERWTRNPDGTTQKVPADMSFEEWKGQYVKQKQEIKAAMIQAASPEFEAMRNAGLMRMPSLDKFAEMQYSNSPAYQNLVARYQNLTGERAWSAVEFNPETVMEHVRSHGAEFGLTTAKEYEAAALAFVGKTEGKLSFVDAGGTRRFFEESTGTLASVYPDGTVRTFFKPRKGIKYWESQVKKYGAE